MAKQTMRRAETLNRGWHFTGPDKKETVVDLPHTWNASDGQDGGNDYWRGSCTYTRLFDAPDFDPDTECVYLEFRGVNASADVTLNGEKCMHHDGGYSTFRRDVTGLLKAKDNILSVTADNSVNDRVYPQKADFTFYGGIYRDVYLIVVNKCHFDMDHFSGPGIRIEAKPCEGYRVGDVKVRTWTNCGEGTVSVRILDADGNMVAEGEGTDLALKIPDVHLWNGLESPYLYTAEATLTVGGKAADRISSRFGVRDFHYHPKTGFYLNGMVVWAEIPYISEHMPNGRENTISQMKELIIQNYNHPSIVCWGISNEITISTKDKADMLDNHRVLNDLVHEMDGTRFTTLACYAMCGPFNKVAHITDVVSWNLYLGWYVPGL